jgi:hypothetical protein
VLSDAHLYEVITGHILRLAHVTMTDISRTASQPFICAMIMMKRPSDSALGRLLFNVACVEWEAMLVVHGQTLRATRGL